MEAPNMTLDGEDIIANVLCLRAVDRLVVGLQRLVQQQLRGVFFMVNFQVHNRLSIIVINAIS
jgi:hypothetical protein